MPPDPFGQARKDATRISNFLKTLAAAEEIFAQAAVARDELSSLQGSIRDALANLSDARKQAQMATAKTAKIILASEEKVAAQTGELAKARKSHDVALDVLTTKTVAAQEQHDQFCRNLGNSRARLQERHDVWLGELAEAGKVARASLDKVEKQRAQMIQDLSGKSEGQ